MSGLDGMIVAFETEPDGTRSIVVLEPCPNCGSVEYACRTRRGHRRIWHLTRPLVKLYETEQEAPDA